MLYRNISYSVKTFYGVTFEPGQVKEVPGYINNKDMIVEETVPSQSAPSLDKPKKSSNKVTVTPETELEESIQDKGDDSASPSSRD